MITREHGLDKECGLGERIIDTGLHASAMAAVNQDLRNMSKWCAESSLLIDPIMYISLNQPLVA